jgi:predicted AlkP superfamily phosphohydrolase/phosphomutase
LLPFITVFATLFLVRSGRQMSDNELGRVEPGNERAGKVLFVMIDSLSASIAEDPKLFPSLERLRPRGLWGRIAGCLPASTVACTRTMFEGSSAGYVASLDNFAARRAGGES